MEVSKLKSVKVCFNSNCKKAVVEQPKKGWSLRSGGCAELCDLCGFTYEEGKFCETFHLNASGWRCCETCGKQIHCGCIVSFHMFVLLDAGGIECLPCTRKSFVLTRNPAWPLPSRVLPSHLERIKDLSGKNWSPIAGSGPVPWRQAPSLFSGHKKVEQAKASFDRHYFSDKMSAFSFERQHNEDSIGQVLSSEKTWGQGILENSFSAFKSEAQSNALAIGSNCTNSTKDDTYGNINTASVSVPKSNSAKAFAAKKSSNHNDLDVSTDNQVHGGKANGDAWGRSQEQFKFVPAFKSEAQSTAFAIGSNCKVSTEDDTYGIPNTASVSVPKNNSAKKIGTEKSSNHNELDASTDNQIHGEKANGDARGRSHVLARCSARVTDQELVQISGENHIITPLFEKTLSASDAGKIGRLVLPKKCAEAYLPSISHPEGLPLEVRDAKGNDWLFQFRFWPNNNSRMYVLEGVSPCIQSLQLQAGDIVTFSRLEPEGKLIMGGRKASATSSTYQVCSCSKNCTKRCETDSMSISKPEERVDIDVSNRTKRKSCTLASKSKSLLIDNCSMVELKLTLKEAQGLLRPPPGNGPNVIVIEDCEIEEYEIAPIIGRPSIPSSDCMGEEIQWVQCDDCLKWRKVSADTLLPSKWTCSANLWDKEKSMCSAAQELTAEHLADLLPAISKASFKKTRVCKAESASIEALEALANLATWEGASLQATTRHPRHKPGCSCIVCMQPPSGKGPKHKQSCDCIVCVSVKRRFRTLMTKRRQQLEKDAEMTLQKLELDTDVDLLGEIHQDDLNGNSAENEIYASPNNARIDLNSQPDRVKELAPRSEFPSMFHLIHKATEIHLEQQNQSCPMDEKSLGGHDSHQTGLMSTMFSSCIPFDGSHERIDMDHHSAPPTNLLTATASTSQ